MVKTLVAASIAWPVLLGSVLWQRIDGVHPLLTSFVYVSASRICHQIPERSFHTAGKQWPVCARCTGLYLSAPFGALSALLWLRRRQPPDAARVRVWLAVAAVPTAITLTLEWSGLAAPGNLVRLVSALPFGAAVAWALVVTAAGSRRSIR